MACMWALSARSSLPLCFARHVFPVQCQSNFTKFVTSACLVRALNDERMNHDNIEIEVRHEGNVAIGNVVEYDLDHVIVVVEVTFTLDVYCAVPLSYAEELMPGRKVVAVGRDISGKLMATSGTLTDSGQSEGCGHLMFSTCKLSEVMQGGALFEFDGNFVAMNLFSDMERPIFLPRDIVFERLNHLRTSKEKIIFLAMLKLVRAVKRVQGEEEWSTVQLELTHANAKQPCCSLHQDKQGSMNVNAFEEHFGDKYPNGVWGEFKKEISSNISYTVVALASFHGESKFFACTGFFIDYDGCLTILTSASLVRDPDGANEIAVIGGPLVDLDGRFMGINYYDTEIGTPFLFFHDIWTILCDLKTKKAMAGSHEGRLRNDNGPPNINLLT
ncbi:hypothetical protein ZEAMMB73_Zm00001d023675 [Zea mays]|uniref:Uncharacterized protein n=1 Tax=Zea mays TaxID=4577 RepID=A0A1D6IUS2_MAIZE|nr:hypothetical protein ZEAMMB73_Zm00001d023675 [Zea mays]